VLEDERADPADPAAVATANATADVASGDRQPSTTSFVLDPELSQALTVLKFDCAAVAANNLSAEELRAKRYSLLQRWYPDEFRDPEAA
jgi:hypothetical protein